MLRLKCLMEQETYALRNIFQSQIPIRLKVVSRELQKKGVGL